MHIDCDRCEVRGDACGDCVVTVLLGEPPGGAHLDGEERRALGVLAEAGFVPPLRLAVGRGGGPGAAAAGTPAGTAGVGAPCPGTTRAAG